MRKRKKECLLVALAIQLWVVHAVCAQRTPDRERDGLIGPVKGFAEEMARLSNTDGKWVERPFVTGEGVSYSRKGWGPWGKRPTSGGYGISLGGHGEFVFDSYGNRTGEIHYSSDDQVTARDFYRYDERGNELEKSCYTAEGKLKERTNQVYDKDTRIEKTVYSGDGVLKARWLYKVDERGNVIEETLFDSGGLKERRTFAYEFDPVGNWTKRTSYLELSKDGQRTLEPEIVTRRTITYY